MRMERCIFRLSFLLCGELTMSEHNNDLLSQTEFAERFGMAVIGRPISLVTLRKWTQEGHAPPCVYIGRFPRWSWSTAQRWINERVRKAEEQAA
ncbi:hypothetical protein [Bradyrhizobium sp. SZCCHNRI20481]|uniref:helix-turn-helix transcriptional regulator n=1 Tax=Bradyrhizobium sp. SZCCHNRI20481 TaxID=3057286 RepID=UPI002915D10A|nr:hypothetical protein [Bradyrhizobium sp. SZCCHNRI20481]